MSKLTIEDILTKLYPEYIRSTTLVEVEGSQPPIHSLAEIRNAMDHLSRSLAVSDEIHRQAQLDKSASHLSRAIADNINVAVHTRLKWLQSALSENVALTPEDHDAALKALKRLQEYVIKLKYAEDKLQIEDLQKILNELSNEIGFRDKIVTRIANTQKQDHSKQLLFGIVLFLFGVFASVLASYLAKYFFK